jgi:hypothetical protein
MSVLEGADCMRKAKIVSLATLIVITFLLILPYTIEEFQWSIMELFALYGLGFIVLIGYLLILPAQEEKRSKKKVRDIGEIKTVTSVACHGCDFSQEREFHAGDYVNKQVGNCHECGRELYVRSIYTVEEK